MERLELSKRRLCRLIRQKAMTLIELLAASALAALLMTAMFGVLGAMSVERRTLFENRAVEPWRDQLIEQLRWDFSNARRMSVTSEELHLIGYGGRDFTTEEATLRPTEVVYIIKNDGHCKWLLRKEIHLDSNSLHNSRIEIAGKGITAIAVQRIDDFQDDDLLENPQASGQSRRSMQTLSSIPSKLRVILFGEGENTRVLDEQILQF